MNKDLALIIAVAFIGLGIVVVVVTNLGPPGSISQFKIPSPFLEICSDEACLEEQKLRSIPEGDRINGVSYGEGWVNLQYQDGSTRLHGSISNRIIQEYIDDPYFKNLHRERESLELGEDWIKLTYTDGSEETIGKLDKKKLNDLIFQLNR